MEKLSGASTYQRVEGFANPEPNSELQIESGCRPIFAFEVPGLMGAALPLFVRFYGECLWTLAGQRLLTYRAKHPRATGSPRSETATHRSKWECR